MLKNKKGITLIALIITIIILLVLAGVVINLSMGENGIITKAQTAVDKYKQTTENEQIELAKFENEIDSYVDGNRGAVTLTNEEYNMFKSQFSKNTNTPIVSINKPNTWTVGIEYDFGDGLYGRRYNGTISAQEKTFTQTVLDSSFAYKTGEINPLINIVSCDGYWANGVYDNCLLYLSFSQMDGWGDDIFARIRLVKEGIVLETKSEKVRSEAIYDVWLLYTKN